MNDRMTQRILVADVETQDVLYVRLSLEDIVYHVDETVENA
jgi:hypothetical protein